MLRKHLFTVVIAILLVTVTALTIREAAATAGVISQSSSTKGAKTLECVELPSRYSLRTEYVKEADMWIFMTEDGPAGVDGGLLDLMSNYRTCSR